MFIIFKIIFMPRTMDWGKTQHGVSNVVNIAEVADVQSTEGG
jgi:hypothetical protein